VRPPSAPGSQTAFDLDELARARRLSDWMFDQFRAALADRAVEVGPGVGTFSARLLDAGVRELLLVEPDSSFAALLERRFGADARVTVVQEGLPESPTLAERPGTYGMALCQNVLEHVDDDAATLRSIAASLGPGGRLALLVPAHPRLFGSLDRAYDHRRRYTRERLTALMDGTGLELLDMYSFNLLGVAGWWVKSRLGATKLGSRSLVAYELLLPLWRPLERRLRPGVGLSLIVHARRPL
jgi:SAM-dependent methyltransferase